MILEEDDDEFLELARALHGNGLDSNPNICLQYEDILLHSRLVALRFLVLRALRLRSRPVTRQKRLLLSGGTLLVPAPVRGCEREEHKIRCCNRISIDRRVDCRVLVGL